MNRPLYVRRRSRRVDFRPALTWLGLTILLLVAVGGGILLLTKSPLSDWFELKLESARYHMLALMPQADHPDFVPAPVIATAADGALPTIEWKEPTTVAPVAAAAVGATPQPTARPTVVAEANSTGPATAPTDTPITATPATTNAPAVPPVASNAVALNPIQAAVQLKGVIPEAQRFNNCGPTTLRMYLSYYGYTKDSQVQIANVLKPDTDDRNVSPNELTGYAQGIGFHMIARVNGSVDEVKQVLSNNMPIMIEEGYDPPRAHEGWMGHYLLLTGYDANGITAQDSYDGPNQHVSWADLDSFWRHFNRTYLLLYTDKQVSTVNAIVGPDMDDTTMYAHAAAQAQKEYDANPKDPFAAFNLGSSLVGLAEYQAAAQAFDQARVLKLPWRMLWYQFGPYEAYYQVGRYQELVTLTDVTQKGVNDLEESYFYKGLALAKLGQTEAARQTLNTALKYNPHYKAAQDALAQLGS